MHLVTRGYFGSHDNDGDHTNRSAIVENPMLQTNFTALSFIERKLLLINFFTLREWGMSDFFASVTLTLTR